MRGRLRGWFPLCQQSQRWVGIVATPVSSLRSSVTLARTSERWPWTEQYTRLRNWQSMLRAKFLHFGVRGPRWGHKWSQRREIWENFDMCKIASCTKPANRWQRDLNWHHDTSLSLHGPQVRFCPGLTCVGTNISFVSGTRSTKKKYQWWLGFYFGSQQMVRLTSVQQQPVHYFFLKSPQKLESSSFTSLPSRKCTIQQALVPHPGSWWRHQSSVCSTNLTAEGPTRLQFKQQVKTSVFVGRLSTKG